MTFQERIFKRLNKTDNFKYLDNLINSGKKEIKLTSDIVLDDSEEQVYGEGIEIITDNLVIDGDGYKIDAKGKARIFSIEHKNITFKNITFKNATPKPVSDSVTSMFNTMKGGAVSAFESKLSFFNCTFKDNADFRVGAISIDFCEVNIDGCKFIGNVGGQYAGAILNDELSSLTVINSEFINNASFEGVSDIQSVESSLRIIDCDFSNLRSDETSIEGRSMGNLILKNSKFYQSCIAPKCLTVIKDCNFKSSTVNVTHFGKVYCFEGQQGDIPFAGGDVHYLDGDMDWVRELTQHEFAREFLKYFPKFNDVDFTVQDKLHDEMIEFLEIWREIWSHESNFVMADVIVNVLTLDPEDIRDNYLNSISREGATDKDSYDRLHMIMEDVLKFVEFPKTFKELDELIHSDKGTVKLISDVCLGDGEEKDFEDGIKLDVDDLVLDGQSHVIDACDKSPIFRIDAKNVTIKNVVFKNAFSHMGGAISNIGDVKFENCKFCKNTASELGGAIVNDEKMVISNCEFKNNSSGGVGGAIAATFKSDLQIINTKFSKNTVSFDIHCPGVILPSDAQGFGGAIYNNGKLDIFESEFLENSCEISGGAMIVLPDSKITIGKSLFRANHAKADGGVLHTMGDINISDSEFTDNSAEGSAGVFDATKSSKMKISNSKFENNTAENGNVIVNKGSLKLIETEISDDDIVDESMEVDKAQPALSDENETVDVESGEETSNLEFPEDYEDYAVKFKNYLEEISEEKDSEGKELLLSLTFAIWAKKFPKDANLVAAALLMAKFYDDELVKTILEDFSQEEYKKRFMEYDPIDEELRGWFMVTVLLVMVVNTSDDD